jgi:hypothetical protein
MNPPGFANRVVGSINDTFFNHLMDRKAILGCPGCLLLAVVSFYGQAQTVTADFGGRSGLTAAVPAGVFAVGGMGDSLTNPRGIATLTSAGLTGTRFWIGLQQVYATSTPNFAVLDSELKIMSAAGVHPIAVIYDTPASLGGNQCGPPSSVSTWGAMAASVVAHADQNFPGLLQDYEIWNEAELDTSLCISDYNTRLNTYVSMYAAAASAMHAQAKADGQTIRTGGPAIVELNMAPYWLPEFLSNQSTAPYVDFVSFHLYVSGQNELSEGMDWPQLYGFTQSSTRGVAYYYQMIESLVRAGKQPNAATTPMYLTEYNDNWMFALDCCRNSPIYGPLWNSLTIVDLLNVVYSGASAGPSVIEYYDAADKYFCLLGHWDAQMDCDRSELIPYPQFYAFQLFASPEYLDLQAGAYMAAAVSPASTTSGLSATAFYTVGANAVVVVNPTSTAYRAVTVTFQNPGLTSVCGTTYLVDGLHGQIATGPVSFSSTSGRYTTTVAVPAYGTVAVSMKGSPVAGAPKAVLNVTTEKNPLAVFVDSSKSQGGGSAIIGRTIDFGDGAWINWTPWITHIYGKAGSYAILLSVKNQSGQISIARSVVNVR